jgi:hypothetical protein
MSVSISIDELTGPWCWRGNELRNDQCWQYAITANDLEEIDGAIVAAKQARCAVESLSREDFPLAGLARKLDEIGTELEQGCGFVRLRGLPLNRWDKTDLSLAWMGIACHVGVPVYQNNSGQLLREIRAEEGDVGHRYGQLKTDGGRFLSSRARTASSAALRFHTDRCDVVGLLCTGVADSGGLSCIASSVAVHTEMYRRSPEHCVEFYRELPRSRIGEEKGGDAMWYLLPVWAVRDGKFTSHYSRTYVEALEHVAGAPGVTETQWQAMDLLAELADELSMEMTLEKGDIQFLNNHVIYHSRTEYKDNPANGMVRSLLRIWLSAPHRALPENHRVLWHEVEKGKIRGGIAQG